MFFPFLHAELPQTATLYIDDRDCDWDSNWLFCRPAANRSRRWRPHLDQGPVCMLVPNPRPMEDTDNAAKPTVGGVEVDLLSDLSEPSRLSSSSSASSSSEDDEAASLSLQADLEHTECSFGPLTTTEGKALTALPLVDPPIDPSNVKPKHYIKPPLEPAVIAVIPANEHTTSVESTSEHSVTKPAMEPSLKTPTELHTDDTVKEKESLDIISQVKTESIHQNNEQASYYYLLLITYFYVL